MAEAVNSLPEASSPERRRRRSGPFLLAYTLLAVVVGAAAGALVVVTGGSDPETRAGGQSWSEWRPTADGQTGAQQIADHVARTYRLASGRQLVAVVAGPLEIEDVEVSAVAVRQGQDGENDEFDVTRVENGVVYAMCGLGRRCSISEGKPTAERGRLVRREALELALYTFKYLANIDAVVTFLPPPGNSETSLALFFKKSDLKEQLARPLRATLPASTPPLASRIDPFEGELVDRLTVPRIFGYGFQQLQDGTAVLVLGPPNAQQE